MSDRVLIMTSCNRIKQTLLALTVDSYVINKPFHAVISDGSSFGKTWEQEKQCHQYWNDEIFEKNYCSDITLFNDYLASLPNIISYRVIHSSPKIPKQIGEATLLNLGIAQASTLTKDPICIKTNGVVMLKYDLFEDVESMLKLNNKDVYVFGRTNAMDQISTRVFGFRGNSLSQAIIKSSWDGWYEYESAELENSGVISNWMEFKMRDTLQNHLGFDKVYHTEKDESGVLLDRGSVHNYKNILEYRSIIESHIDAYKIPKDNSLIKEFLEGGIW